MNSEKNLNSIRLFFVFATLLVLMILFGIFDLGRQFRNHVVRLEEMKNQPAAIETGKQTAEMTSGRIVNVDTKHGSNLYFACASCHGDQAQGNKTLNAPALNVQEDWYMVRQLKKFKDGIRGTNPKDVPGMQMRPMALTLKDEQAMIDLAGHIATFKTKEIQPPEQTLSGDVNKGRSFYTPCTVCHGDQGQGNKTLHAPALAGQHDWYILMQMKNFKEGIRGADPKDTSGALMRPMMMTLPNEQAMIDVVAYISTFPILTDKSKPAEKETTIVAKNQRPDPTRGRDVFEANCAACHQKDGTGTVGLAPSIRNRDFLAIASDEFIRKTVILGRPGTAMIARPDLSDDLTHVIAFLRSLPVSNPVEIAVDPTKVYTGDSAAGSHKYSLYCASCHGPNGEGYSAGGSGPGIGLPGFLLLVSDDYIFQTVKHGRVGTPMRPFIGAKGLANLGEDDVHDIIVYLRSLAHVTTGTSSETASMEAFLGPNPHKGETIFQTNCAACHQKNGEGIVGLAPSIRNRDFLAIASDDFIKQTIREGRLGTAMVPRPDLAEADLNHIIAFLRSLPVAIPITVSIDPLRQITGSNIAGRTKFTQFCASCHGPRGEGYSAGGSGPGIGLSGFLNAASDDYIFQTLKQGRVGTPMKSFIGAKGVANLDETDVNDIIAYLRSL